MAGTYRYEGRTFTIANGLTRTRTYNGRTYTAVLVDATTGAHVTDSDAPPWAVSPPLPPRSVAQPARPRTVSASSPQPVRPMPEIDESDPERAAFGRRVVDTSRRLIASGALSREIAQVWARETLKATNVRHH